MSARTSPTGPVTIYAPLDTDGWRHKVYLGWHHEMGCPVACKKYSSLRRADREADVLRELTHPAIVRCFGTASPGYLLTEILDGQTLHEGLQQLDSRRLSISNTMRLGIRVGAALDYTHRRGFVHLDVKPGNIIISGGHPKLIDFGAARSISAEATHYNVGTTIYMAPEMCLHEKVGAPADVFGLGVTLFECLTSEKPFNGRFTAKNVPQVTKQPRRVRDIRPSVPAGLCDLINAMLAREPEARPDLRAAMARMNEFIVSGPKVWPYGQ